MLDSRTEEVAFGENVFNQVVREIQKPGVIKSERLFGTKSKMSTIRKRRKKASRSVNSGENDDDWMSRVQSQRGIPRFDLQRRSVYGTEEETEHFRDDELPRPPGLQRLAKSQCLGFNSTASSGSNPATYQEFMAEQIELDRKAKIPCSREEVKGRRRLDPISTMIAVDIAFATTHAGGIRASDTAIIYTPKRLHIRAAYHTTSRTSRRRQIL
ncbi:hypothetical protein Tco_0967564 [Tanacetum coccineum]